MIMNDIDSFTYLTGSFLVPDPFIFFWCTFNSSTYTTRALRYRTSNVLILILAIPLFIHIHLHRIDWTDFIMLL